MNTARLTQLLAISPAGSQDELKKVALHHDVLRFFVSRSTVSELREVFGSGYPKWQEQAQLPSAPGAVAVPVTIECGRPLPLAAEAAVLPVQWTTSTADPRNLPIRLLQVARQVLEHARESPRLMDQYGARLSLPWTIQWSLPAWQEADFSDLPLTPESAYAPLSVGLVSAISNNLLSRDFFCTGQWNAITAGWHVNNQTLKRKLKTGIDLGFRRFVVPAASRRTLDAFLEDDKAMGSGEVQTAVLRDEADLDAAIADANVIAGCQPPISAPAKERERWYDSIRDESTARKFYESHLIGDAKNAASIHLEKSDLHDLSPDTLISVVSHSSELIKLAVLTFRPKRCILIHTNDEHGSAISRALEDLRDWFGQDKARAPDDWPQRIQVSDGIESLDQIVEVVSSVSRTAVESEGKSGVLLDVTPGKRTMMLAMLQAARQGDRVLCWWHDTAPHNRRAKPLSVQPLIWEVLVSRGLLPLCPRPGSGEIGSAKNFFKKL